MPKLLLPLTLCLALHGFVHGQSDDCADAPELGPGIHAGTTIGATNSGTSSCVDSANSPDVWYRYTATETCRLSIASCGSAFDTALAIYGGCPAVRANEIACDDDFCGLQSRVTTVVESGNTYWIRVTGYDGEAGEFTLDVSCGEIAQTEQADDCGDAIPVEPGTVIGSTEAATNDGSASCGRSALSPDVWYTYTADRDCLLVASTCGSPYDTVLSIHDSCPGSVETQLACNDDACSVQSTVGSVVLEGETYWIRVSGFDGEVGEFVLEVSCRDIPTGGPDLQVSDLRDMTYVESLGDRVAFSVETQLCNVGGAPLAWIANPDPRHPFLVFNLYRRFDDRFEQVGQSWAKHGFAASEDEYCGTDCIPSNDDALGIGCADVYDVLTNAEKSTFGPRDEINPWTGEFTFAGSHIDLRQGLPFGPVEQLLETTDDVLSRNGTPGAQLFFEFYVVTHNDMNHSNNIGHEVFDVVSDGGGGWSPFLQPGDSTTGPAADAWAGAARVTVPEEPVDDGRAYLYSKVTENDDGTWHYEYALYNLDMDRGIASFTVPFSPGTTVTNVAHHAPRSHDDGYSNEPWETTETAASITWSTERFDENPASNPIRWGTMYNFRFDADTAPADGAATLGLFKPGTPGSLDATVQTPSAAASFRRGDSNQDGSLDISDPIATLAHLFQGAEAPTCFDASDANDDGDVDISDAVSSIHALFLGDFELPAPGSTTCGIDPTADPLVCIAYPDC